MDQNRSVQYARAPEPVILGRPERTNGKGPHCGKTAVGYFSDGSVGKTFRKQYDKIYYLSLSGFSRLINLQQFEEIHKHFKCLLKLKIMIKSPPLKLV